MTMIKTFTLRIIFSLVFTTSAFGKISRETALTAWEKFSEAKSIDVIPLEYEEDGAPNVWVDFEDEGNYSAFTTLLIPFRAPKRKF